MKVAELIKSHNWNMPTTCPACGAELEINDSGVLFCPNNSCEQKVFHKVGKLTNVWNVLGIGPAIIEDFVRAEKITTNYDFLTKLKNPSLDTVCGKNAEKIRRNFAKRISEGFSVADFLASFDLDGYGRRSIQSLVDEGFTYEDLLDKTNVGKIANTKGWTEKSAEELLQLIQDNIEDIKLCKQLIEFKEDKPAVVGGKLAGLSFCFTGAMAYKRSDLEKMVTDNGGTISSVNKTLSFLVQADPDSTSSKSEKAKKFGTKIITPEAFLEMLK